MTQPVAFQLNSRSCTVTVGSVQIANIGQQVGLDVWFQVRRSLRPKEPNTCDVRLYNLADSTRKAIAGSVTGSGTKAPIVPVTVQAGYVGGTSAIFQGQMRAASTITDGPDTVTELTTGDGDQAAVIARSASSFKAGATAYMIALQLLADMKAGQGNIASVQSILRATPMFSGGVVLKGSSLEHLIDLAHGCGLEVTLQQGVAQWTSLGQPLGGQAYSLTPSTGLLGSPTVDTKGVLSCVTLMLPGLGPGSPISVSSAYVQGLFRITTIETLGETAGEQWQHSIEAKPYGLGV